MPGKYAGFCVFVTVNLFYLRFKFYKSKTCTCYSSRMKNVECRIENEKIVFGERLPRGFEITNVISEE